MGRLGLTKDMVEKTAEALLNESAQIPTVIAVRESLGQGSHTTIHKYLKAWKQERLSRPNIIKNDSDCELDELQYEKEELEEKFTYTVKQLKSTSFELIAAERKIAKLQVENDEKKSSLVLYEQENEKLAAENEKLIAILQERDIGIERYQKNKESQIESLKLELKNLNYSFFNEIRELSSTMNDKVVEAKVTAVNLEVKLKERERELQQQNSKVLIMQQDQVIQQGKIKRLEEIVNKLPKDIKGPIFKSLDIVD